MDNSRLETGKSIVKGAISLLSTSLSSEPVKAKPVVVEKSPQDIPKEELVALCMKLNKRMQALESKYGELLQRKTRLLTERKGLLELITIETNVPLMVSEEADVDLPLVSDSWGQWLKGNKQKLRNLESKMTEQNVDDGSSLGVGIVETASVEDIRSKFHQLEEELQDSKKSEEYLRSQLAVMEGEIRCKQELLQQLKDEVETSVAKKEEAVLYLQLQLNKIRDEENVKGQESLLLYRQLEQLQVQNSTLKMQLEERELACQENKEIIVSLQRRCIELEPGLERAKDRIKELEKNATAAIIMKAEQEAMLNSLRRDLRIALEQNEGASRQAEELTELRNKSDELAAKFSVALSKQSILQSQVEEKDSLVTRLRSEALSSERNHAMRTAMLATCEAQISALQQENLLKDATNKEALERIQILQDRLAGSESRLEERMKEMKLQQSLLEQQICELSKKHESEVDSLTEKNATALENLKRDFAKKSSMARSLLSEKEEELRALQGKIAEQQAEIQSGAPNERRIFELAQVQAKRDAVYGAHNDTREVAFQQLQAALASKDLQLAELQQNQVMLNAEVVELRRSTRREGVNMDYLKNVVLQYMTFPINSPERNSLVPVLAMLLQFNSKELAEIDKSQVVSIWGSRPVKEVKRSLRAADTSNSGDKVEV